MKILKIKILLVAAGLVALVSGCKRGIDDFGTLNQNPNATTVPVTAALLTNAQANLSGFGWGNALNIAGGLYAQYFSETQYTDQSRYASPTVNWDGIYAGPLYDLQNIINVNANPQTKDRAALYGSNNNQIAIARILKAYYFMQLTDAFGDIPYREALKGEGVLAYEKQEVIYPDLINELKAAVAQFDNGATVQGDIIYAGNTTKWKKLANSLRAIMALRMSKANATLGRTEFAAAIAAGVIDNNADNFQINFPGGSFQNPLYVYYNVTQRFDYATSKTVTDRLQALNDPRINVFASSTVGFPYGLSRDQAIAFATANPNWSLIMAPQYRTETSPVYLLTAANLYFARAEAALLGWTTESVSAMYTAGVTAALSQWGISSGDITTYLAQPGVILAPGNELQRIAEQRWLSHFPEGMSGWSLWRRTGLPALTPAPGTTTIPRRLPYGPNEQLYNPANYQTAANQYTVGGVSNSMFARVWWDRP